MCVLTLWAEFRLHQASGQVLATTCRNPATSCLTSKAGGGQVGDRACHLHPETWIPPKVPCLDQLRWRTTRAFVARDGRLPDLRKLLSARPRWPPKYEGSCLIMVSLLDNVDPSVYIRCAMSLLLLSGFGLSHLSAGITQKKHGFD